jgi:hypothetical protein
MSFKYIAECSLYIPNMRPLNASRKDRTLPAQWHYYICGREGHYRIVNSEGNRVDPEHFRTIREQHGAWIETDNVEATCAALGLLPGDEGVVYKSLH